MIKSHPGRKTLYRRIACCGPGLTTTLGAFLGLPTSPAARALGPTSTPAQDGKKLKSVGRQLGQVLWNLIPTLFWPPHSLLAKKEYFCTRSSQDPESELRLVLAYMTLGSSISEEHWEGRREENGHILTKMLCTSDHNLFTVPKFPSITENHPTWERR